MLSDLVRQELQSLDDWLALSQLAHNVSASTGSTQSESSEEIKAVVEPADGVAPGDDLTEELLAHCAERLARFKLPRSIDYTTEMPRDPNGKLYKRKLRDPYWADRAAAI